MCTEIAPLLSSTSEALRMDGTSWRLLTSRNLTRRTRSNSPNVSEYLCWDQSKVTFFVKAVLPIPRWQCEQTVNASSTHLFYFYHVKSSEVESKIFKYELREFFYFIYLFIFNGIMFKLFIPGFYFFLSKAVSWIIFCILFRVSNHQSVDEKN